MSNGAWERRGWEEFWVDEGLERALWFNDFDAVTITIFCTYFQTLIQFRVAASLTTGKLHQVFAVVCHHPNHHARYRCRPCGRDVLRKTPDSCRALRSYGWSWRPETLSAPPWPKKQAVASDFWILDERWWKHLLVLFWLSFVGRETLDNRDCAFLILLAPASYAWFDPVREMAQS